MRVVYLQSDRKDAAPLSNVRPITRTRLLTLMRTLLLLFTAMSVSSSQALTVPSVIGSVIPLEKVNDIKAQPLALLAKFPDAGNAMARYVAKVLDRDPSVIDSILSIVNDTSPAQASAIGAGLVRGVRAMAVDRAKTARLVTAKIMRVENPWLKTTFTAIGPSYASDRPFTAPAPLAPAELKNAPVGEELPVTQSRLGPVKENDITFYDSDYEPTKQPGKIDFRDSGTIVAILLSDAPQNGAVSTSPTQ